MNTYLVVGASGTVGSCVVHGLVDRGEEVRAMTSRAERAGAREGKVLWVHANLATGEGVAEAFEGVQRAFLLAPPGHADQHAVLRPLIDEARRRQLEKVVLMSAMGANAVETTPLRQAELALERSGLAYNIVRPNWFMQNFHTFWLHGINTQGKILLPAGKAKVSLIDARDIADVVLRLLTSHDLDNQAFDITGPEALDHDEVAAILSRVTGKTIRYQEITPEQMNQALLGAGLPADYAAFLVTILGFLAQGYAAP
ncbi:MAG TPA: NAD(P)H-binding protein, partial [Ramlibacter sp.]|uniref:NAD(P)H-binding protein n=1 Tax=Ramlibacter sp. TaxID=1917967 RepID=UPI002D7EE351